MIRLFFLLFLCCVSCAEIHWNETMFVVRDDMDRLSLYDGSMYYYDIINPNDFKLKLDDAVISYKLYEPYRIEIISYAQIQRKKRELQSVNQYSDIFGKEIIFGVFRAIRRDGNCITVPEANNTIKLFDLSLRLLTGNRMTVRYDQLYFSSKCLKADYNTGSRSVFKNSVFNDACEIDGVCKTHYFNTRIIFADRNENAYPGVKGLADAGHVDYFVQRIRYAAYIRWTESTMDPNHQQVLTTIHELYHTVAFGHANYLRNSYTGLVRFFFFECDRYDYSSIMGYQTSWYGLPGVYHYINMLTNRGIEPFMFPTAESGKKRLYRIFAWDFPYVRTFLMQNLPDGYWFDDVPFGRNGLSVRIPISNTTIYSKMEDPTLVKGTLMLEFRWNIAGQRDWKRRGVRFSPGDIKKRETDFGFYEGKYRCSILMDANFENDAGIESTSLPLGVTYYPKEQDIGTFYFRITKWHPPINIAVNDDTIRDTSLKDYKELPYVEMEIGYFPKVKHTFAPVKTLPDPTFIFSPNVFNCKIEVDENNKRFQLCDNIKGYTWSYMISNGLRDVNTPRMYNANGVIEYARFGTFNTFSDSSRVYFNVRYGDDDTNIGSLHVQLKEIKDPYYYFLYNQKSVLSVIEDGKEKELMRGNILFVNKIIIDDDLSDFIISDLYNTKIGVNVENGRITMKIDDLKIQGFSELFLIGRNKNKETKSGKRMYIYQNDNVDKRVAFEYLYTTNDHYYVFNVYPAVIPNNCRTQPSLFQSRHISANELFIYPMLYMNPSDYFYIDINGMINPDLIIKIETDNGNYSKEMKPFTGLNDVSILISFLEINNNTGAYGQIYSFTFNQDVEILNIRPVYCWPYANLPPKQESGEESIPVSPTETYHIVSKSIEISFKFTSFKSKIFGKEYSFNEERQKYEVRERMDDIPTFAPTTGKPTFPPVSPNPTSTISPTDWTEKPTSITSSPTAIPTTTATDDDDDEDNRTDTDRNDNEDNKTLYIIIAAASAALAMIIICCVCICCCRAKQVNKASSKGTKEANKSKKPEYPTSTYVPRQTVRV